MTVLMLNGELIAPEKATLPATDRALTHGLGLYETLKLVGGIPVFFEEHVARLDLGLEELGLERPCSRAEMAADSRQICAAISALEQGRSRPSSSRPRSRRATCSSKNTGMPPC